MIGSLTIEQLAAVCGGNRLVNTLGGSWMLHGAPDAIRDAKKSGRPQQFGGRPVLAPDTSMGALRSTAKHYKGLASEVWKALQE